MASYKKAGQCNVVRKGQLWKNTQNGRIGEIMRKGSTSGGKGWIMNIGKKSHHINEGTLLKCFELV